MKMYYFFLLSSFVFSLIDPCSVKNNLCHDNMQNVLQGDTKEILKKLFSEVEKKTSEVEGFSLQDELCHICKKKASIVADAIGVSPNEMKTFLEANFTNSNNEIQAFWEEVKEKYIAKLFGRIKNYKEYKDISKKLSEEVKVRVISQWFENNIDLFSNLITFNYDDGVCSLKEIFTDIIPRRCAFSAACYLDKFKDICIEILGDCDQNSLDKLDIMDGINISQECLDKFSFLENMALDPDLPLGTKRKIDDITKKIKSKITCRHFSPQRYFLLSEILNCCTRK